ncbi:MAG: hypothetical protein K2K93_00100 [Muribaculaceae bacterium]|nr:hypothetical protein [Muribaculaceae bacterium]
MPGFTRGEGLFVSIFRKPEDACSPFPSPWKKKRKYANTGRKKPAKDAAVLTKASSWISMDAEIRPLNERMIALSPQTAYLLDSLPKGVHIISAGIEVAEAKGKDLIPSHSLAMSTAFSHAFPEVELSGQDALRYLSRDAITLPPETDKGYVTVTYRGFPLGFLKNIGNRTNSLYPREYRILTQAKEESGNPE